MAQEEYKTYPIRIRVISQKGYCAMLHKVGDEWVYKYEPGKLPETPNICEAALHSMALYFKPLWWGALFPFPTVDPDTFLVACPDAANPVFFELKRLRDQPIYLHYGGKYDPDLKD